MLKRGILLLLLLVVVAGVVPTSAQGAAPVITLDVRAGFDGLFRENDWFPLLVQVSNDGDNVTGRLVVRPQTSGNAFTNTFSTPVDMPAGSRKNAFLYVTARSFATEVRVEFLDDDDITLAAQQVPLRSVLAQDQLHVVLTESSAGSVDLTGVGAGGYNTYQANWRIENLPDQMAALETVDMIVFSDIDTGPMPAPQRQAIADWVMAGGHLIVTGGPNWQATAAGLADLLPLQPAGSDTLDTLASLAAFVSADRDDLDEATIIATGSLTPDARTLAATSAGVPLLARRSAGLGTVDYLAADPLAQPLRGWGDLGQLWFTLASTRAPQPGWARGITDYDRAANATEVLPGLDLLPDVLPLCGFLAIYVALIGPLNYAVLNRVNRREYAWATIPLFIVVFSGLAWVVGFNLRGNTATLSRLAIVQSWPDSEHAQVDGLIGLLSPRRSNYTLTMTDGSLLRPVSRAIQANPFAASVQSSTDIQQSDQFRADNFTVDASFIATFNTATVIDAPDLGGQATLFYEPPRLDEDDVGHWSVRGSVRNDTDFTLNSPVILARGVSLPLEAPLEPGDLKTFTLPIISRNLQPAAPSPLERNTGQEILRFAYSRYSRDVSNTEQTVRDIMGDSLYSVSAYTRPPGPTAIDQENYRRQLLLSAAMRDHFLSTGRGNRVFLVGWADAMPLTTELEGATWEPMDTTLYIAELDVRIDPPAGSALVTADQFTWVATERASLSAEIAPINADFQQGDVAVFRFTPLPDSVLADVETLHIEINLTGGSRFSVPIEVWDWNAKEWAVIELQRPDDRTTVRRRSIRNPDRFLGAQNAVQIRLTVDDDTNTFLRLTRLAVEQEGRF